MMKHLLLCLATLIAALHSPAVSAQRYEPKVSWPYVYETFQNGTVRMLDGKLLPSERLNISVLNGRLHYIKDGTIMVADMSKVFTAKAGEDVFVNVGGKLYKVIKESDHGGAVVKAIGVDYDRMGKADIGYGIASSTASTQNLSLVGLQGASESTVNMLAATAESNKEQGAVIPVRESSFLLAGKRLVPCLRRAVMGWPGLDRDSARNFLKENKIRWNDPESAVTVADFLAAQFSSNQSSHQSEKTIDYENE